MNSITKDEYNTAAGGCVGLVQFLMGIKGDRLPQWSRGARLFSCKAFPTDEQCIKLLEAVGPTMKAACNAGRGEEPRLFIIMYNKETQFIPDDKDGNYKLQQMIDNGVAKQVAEGAFKEQNKDLMAFQELNPRKRSQVMRSSTNN